MISPGRETAIDCSSCGRAFPEVVGASTQVCPHCGHETGAFLAAQHEPARGVDPAAAVARAFRLYAARWPRLVAAWVPAAILEVLVVVAIYVYAQRTGMPLEPDRMGAGDQLRYLGVAAPLYLGLFVVKMACWSVVAAVALDRPVRPLLTRPLPFLALGAVLTLLYLAGVLLIVVPFLVFYHWFLYAPAVAADTGAGVGRSMEESRAFARRMRTFGFTALVLFVWLGTVIVSIGASALVAGVGAWVGIVHPLVAEIAAPLVGALVAPLVPLLPASFWGLAKDARPAPPASGALPAERFRTTRCPQCGTLVPYTATGDPVEVVCPVCGRAGRVL